MLLYPHQTNEKQTINRLLKKQVSRRSNREKGGAEESDADNDEDEGSGNTEKKAVDPRQARIDKKGIPRSFFRYVQGREGSTLSLPFESGDGDEEGVYKARWDATFTAPVM